MEPSPPFLMFCLFKMLCIAPNELDMMDIPYSLRTQEKKSKPKINFPSLHHIEVYIYLFLNVLSIIVKSSWIYIFFNIYSFKYKIFFWKKIPVFIYSYENFFEYLIFPSLYKYWQMENMIVYIKNIGNE